MRGLSGMFEKYVIPVVELTVKGIVLVMLGVVALTVLDIVAIIVTGEPIIAGG